MFEPLFKELTFYLAYAIEAAAALIIAAAATTAIAGSVRVLARRARTASTTRSSNGTDQEQVRLELGRWLAMALEFDLAADRSELFSSYGNRKSQGKLHPSIAAGGLILPIHCPSRHASTTMLPVDLA